MSRFDLDMLEKASYELEDDGQMLMVQGLVALAERIEQIQRDVHDVREHLYNQGTGGRPVF